MQCRLGFFNDEILQMIKAVEYLDRPLVSGIFLPWESSNEIRHYRDDAEIFRKPESCEICQLEVEKLCFDHDHKTGEFRGWLCQRCNKSIGKFEDNPELIKKAVEYIVFSLNHPSGVFFHVRSQQEYFSQRWGTTSEIIKKAKLLRLSGLSFSKIGDELNCTRNTATRWVQS